MASDKNNNESASVKNSASIQRTQQALEEIDRIFHEKARLGILTCLVSDTQAMGFNQLKELCGLTDGNLNRHLKVLIDAEVVKVKKSGRGRNTQSVYSLTKLGRQSFENYIQALETIVQSAKPAILPDDRSDISFA